MWSQPSFLYGFLFLHLTLPWFSSYLTGCSFGLPFSTDDSQIYISSPNLSTKIQTLICICFITIEPLLHLPTHICFSCSLHHLSKQQLHPSNCSGENLCIILNSSFSFLSYPSVNPFGFAYKIYLESDHSHYLYCSFISPHDCCNHLLNCLLLPASKPYPQQSLLSTVAREILLKYACIQHSFWDYSLKSICVLSTVLGI